MELDSGPACRICGQIATLQQICGEQYVRGGIPFTCVQCGAGYFYPTTLDPAVDDYWEGDPVNKRVYTIPEVRAAFARKYERYLVLLDETSWRNGKKNLLEVGCGSGIFLEPASRHGWLVHGLDVSRQAVDLTRQFCPTARVTCAPLEEAGFNSGTFDLIALWDVIEHVEYPEKFLRDVQSLLAPGGILILETPDEGCPARCLVRIAHRLTAGRLSLLHLLYYPAHRWYFSRRAMTLVLKRVGFQNIRFYRERTVKEFGKRKSIAYGMRQSLFERMTGAVADMINVIPVLRNKMVVIAVKPDSDRRAD